MFRLACSRFLLIASFLATIEPILAGTCCFSKWGGTSDCGSYVGPGGKCNGDPAKTCSSNSDCPDAPPTPAPPTPSPPAPPSPPGPSPPSNGTVRGFWFGYAGSSSQNPAPKDGWFFMFPGTITRPPFDPKPYATIMPPPSWGTYEKKILTQGGGDTDWGDSLYTTLKGQLGEYKKAGWDGICWDWEKTSSDHTTEGFNDLMRGVKAAGLVNIVTSTAEGPYVWASSDKNATGIDWSAVDYFVPQLYGADGKLSDPLWPQYAQYWVNGAGKPNVHNVTFSAIPMKKFLWGMPAGSCDQAAKFGGSGCIEWDYSPSVHPSSPSVVHV